MSVEDHVVHLLASLPDSFDMLVTAIETNENSHRAVITWRKAKDKKEKEGECTRALASRTRSSQSSLKCHHCESQDILSTTVTNWLLIKKRKRNLTSRQRSKRDMG